MFQKSPKILFFSPLFFRPKKPQKKAKKRPKKGGFLPPPVLYQPLTTPKRPLGHVAKSAFFGHQKPWKFRAGRKRPTIAQLKKEFWGGYSAKGRKKPSTGPFFHHFHSSRGGCAFEHPPKRPLHGVQKRPKNGFFSGFLTPYFDPPKNPPKTRFFGFFRVFHPSKGQPLILGVFRGLRAFPP